LSVWEKIGVTEILRVSRYGSGWYLRLPRDLCDALGLQPGDRLRIKIEARRRLAVEGAAEK